jgi:two-component system, chemotaxis family, chemotaxis protein CheY
VPRTILAVDDSKVALHKYRLILSRYTVIPASNGIEAIEALSRHPEVDLILLDLNMPRMNGFEFLQTLRKNPRHERIPVLVISSEGREQEVSRALALGAKSYLTKPFPPRDLPRLVAATIRVPTRRAKPAPARQRERLLPASGRPRVSCGEPCDIVVTDRLWHGLLWNLSVGGAYLVVSVPFRVGDAVRLKFSLPGERASIACDGRIAWVNPPLRAAGSGSVATQLPAGCGLEFGRIDPGDRTRIDTLVRARAAEAP